MVTCSSHHFPFVGVRTVICHSDVRLLSLFVSIVPCGPVDGIFSPLYVLLCMTILNIGIKRNAGKAQ